MDTRKESLSALREGLDETRYARATQLIDLMLSGKQVELSQVFHLLLRLSPLIDESIKAHRENLYQRQLSYQAIYEDGVAQSCEQLQFCQLWTDLLRDDDCEALVKTDMNLVATCINRCFMHLSNLQKWHYENYHPLPKGFWQTAHRLYRFSSESHIDDFALIDVEGIKQLTLKQLYISIVLFETTNPSGLTFGEIDKVSGLLGWISQMVDLRDKVNRADLYAVDLSSDLGPLYLTLAQKEIDHASWWRTFDLSSVVDKLHEIAGQNVQEDQIDHKGFLLDRKTVKRLVRIWQSKPTRKFPRVPQEGKVNVEVTMPLVEDSVMGNSVQAWEMVNTSPNGYCLTKLPEYPAEMSVGDVIRVQEHGEAASKWSIAVVRWLRHDEQGVLLMGVELLSPEASMVDILAKEERLKALMLPNLQSIGLEASLIIPSFAGESGDVIQVFEPVQNLKLEQCVHSGNKVSVYRFSTV